MVLSPFFLKSLVNHFTAILERSRRVIFKFVDPTQLAQAAQKPVLRLLDICYGLGYNTAAALQTIWAVNPSCHVELIGLELNPAVPQAAIAHHLFDNWNYEYTEILSQLAFEQQVQTDRLKAKLLIGDARTSIELVHQSGFQADAIFLDPFSPPQCPQLWTVEFIKQVVIVFTPRWFTGHLFLCCCCTYSTFICWVSDRFYPTCRKAIAWYGCSTLMRSEMMQ